MLTIREKPFPLQNSSLAGADHEVKKKKKKKKKKKRNENKPEMQARATLAPLTYFCVQIVRKRFTDKPLKHSVRRKNWKKKEKERESDVWNFPGSEEGSGKSGNPQLKNGKASATTA